MNKEKFSAHVVGCPDDPEVGPLMGGDNSIDISHGGSKKLSIALVARYVPTTIPQLT